MSDSARTQAEARRKMAWFKLSTVWTEFRIVLWGDLFLSNKEHTRFPSILLGGWSSMQQERQLVGLGSVVGLQVSGVLLEPRLVGCPQGRRER